MTLLLIFISLVILTAILVLWPVIRNKAANPGNAAHKKDVLIRQLKEVDSDLDRNVISPEDAAAKRVEISRRLLAEDKAEAQTARPSFFNVNAAIVCVILSCGAAFGIYAFNGNPDLEGKPYASRLENATGPERSALLIQMMEQRLFQNPDSGEGWELIAPIYMRLGQFDKAAQAWSNVIRLLGATSERLIDFAEADIQASDGRVTKAAARALEIAEETRPLNPKVQFYLALLDEQNGNPNSAIQRLVKLSENAPDDAQWVSFIRQRLAELRTQTGDLSDQKPANPTQEDIENAASLEASDRQVMIENMVDGLEERLMSDGGSLAEWQRLIRSASVLGDMERAQSALDAAKRDLKDDVAAITVLEQIKAQMNLK